jgi:adenylate kinase family enzyme
MVHGSAPVKSSWYVRGVSSHRVNVLGASGVGKSTLAARLAERLGVPHFDGDDYYHLPTDPPFREQRTPEDRCALLERDLAGLDGWTLSGGVATWTPAPRIRTTLLVFLWLPPAIRLARLERRERERYGARILPGGDMAEDHAAFLAWTRGYEDGTAEGTNTRPLHEEAVRRARCPVLRLEGEIGVVEAVGRVLEVLGVR